NWKMEQGQNCNSEINCDDQAPCRRLVCWGNRIKGYSRADVLYLAFHPNSRFSVNEAGYLSSSWRKFGTYERRLLRTAPRFGLPSPSNPIACLRTSLSVFSDSTTINITSMNLASLGVTLS